MSTPPPSIPAAALAPSMGELIARIVAAHHPVLRRQIIRIDAIVRHSIGPAAADDPVLLEIRQLAEGLRACVEMQLDKEEQTLFPMLRRLEEQTVITRCHAGIIRSRIVIAERDLARIRGVISRLKDLAHEALSPDGPCETCHELLLVIEELLVDLREHTRKECEVLYPWAVEREAALVR